MCGCWDTNILLPMRWECEHGVVAKVKRCIMERDLYPRRWGLGPTATEKKKLKASGKLDKFGRANEQTPAKWTAEYKDYTAPADAAAAPAADVTMSEAPAVDVTALLGHPLRDSDLDAQILAIIPDSLPHTGMLCAHDSKHA